MESFQLTHRRFLGSQHMSDYMSFLPSESWDNRIMDHQIHLKQAWKDGVSAARQILSEPYQGNSTVFLELLRLPAPFVLPWTTLTLQSHRKSRFSRTSADGDCYFPATPTQRSTTVQLSCGIIYPLRLSHGRNCTTSKRWFTSRICLGRCSRTSNLRRPNYSDFHPFFLHLMRPQALRLPLHTRPVPRNALLTKCCLKSRTQRICKTAMTASARLSPNSFCTRREQSSH